MNTILHSAAVAHTEAVSIAAPPGLVFFAENSTTSVEQRPLHHPSIDSMSGLAAENRHVGHGRLHDVRCDKLLLLLKDTG